MPRKCSLGGCKENYRGASEKRTVHQFPKDPEERRLWCSALPNILDYNKVTRNMGVCDIHWPASAPKQRFPGGAIRPTVPPSIFPSLPQSFQHQTASKKPRQVARRGLSLSSRNAIPDELDAFIKADKIPPVFDDFVAEIKKREFLANFHIVCEKDRIVVFSFEEREEYDSPPGIDVWIVVKRNYRVKAYKSKTSVKIRDLLGYQWELQRWSQLEAILNFVKQHELNEMQEILGHVQILRNKLRHSEIYTEVSFMLEQLELSVTKPSGRRYSPDTVKVALGWYLCNRRSLFMTVSIFCS